MPLWAAVAVVAAAYLVRSAQRGWDFRPDLPLDAVLGVLLVALVVLRAAIARSAAPHESDEQGEAHMGEKGGSGDEPRQRP